MKKNFKAKSLSILSTVAILSAMVPHASASVTLSDISSSYAKEEINELVQKGIIYGTGDGKFNPTSNIKRQDFAILLVRALNLDTDNPPQSPSFKDVPQNNYAFSAIEAAVKAGLIKGMGNGVFGINQNLTREQMAVIFVNALGVNSAGKGQNLAFSDVNSISDWAKDAVGAAVELELMKGNPDGTFKPNNQASRQEVALVAYKFLNEKTKIDEQKPSVTPPPTPIPQTPTPIPVPTPSTGGTPSTGTGGNSSNNGDLEIANLVKAAIAALPAKGDVMLTDKTAVEKARTEYGALTTAQKTMVGDITRLTEAEAAIAELEAQAAVDLETANRVKAAIEGLPVKEDVELADKAAVEEARTKYEALTATQKALVGDITRLTEAEAAIVELEAQAAADLEAANLVKVAIEGLPVKEEVELADKAAVQEARTKYEALTANQKALVGDITRLTEAEAAIADWQVIALAIENLKVTYNGVDVSVLLPNNQDGANVTWSLKDPTQSSIIDVLNGDIIRAGLTADTNIVLVATIISGSKSTNKEFVITVQAEVAEPKSILSKEITNFDFTNVYATQAREESNKIISTDFKTNPKHFTISDGNITIPVDLTWDIPLNGFSTGQVVGSAIDSFIQDYCNAHGINLGDRTVGGYGFEDTFFISTFKTGSSAAITLGGNDWSFFFQNNHWTGTDEDSTKNRTFVVSDGVNQASIVLRQKFTDMSNLVTYLNNQLQSASVSVTAEQVDASQFKLVSNSSNTDITITGNDKEQFFDN
ncbi:S-layer homology domain-containing protein [Paenibacillus illinoisensis]|uniref:S-layer homology domain-containing protein n=1 Tax=Paenibacillus illinoisensis TaxID=59845 RepID=UPI003D2C4522